MHKSHCQKALSKPEEIQLCYVLSGLKAERRVDFEMGFSMLEVMVLEIQPKKQKLLTIVVYRHPKTDMKSITALLDQLETIFLNWKHDAVITDFNIDLSVSVSTLQHR